MMSASELNGILRNLHFLAGANDDWLQRLAETAVVQDYEAQQIIARQGDPAAAIYLVVSGQVSLEICGAGVGCKRIMTVGPGELLGWSAVLEPVQWTATARTSEATRVVRLEGTALMQLCEQDPYFGYHFMRRVALAISKRLSATRLQLLDVYGTRMPATTDVRTPVASVTRESGSNTVD